MITRAFRLTAAGIAALGAVAEGVATDQNIWPVYVRRESAPPAEQAAWHAAGPIGFFDPRPDGGTDRGIRPLWLTRRDADEKLESWHVLYPLLSYRKYDHGHAWSFFNLVLSDVVTHDRGKGSSSRDSFAIWPFYFSRQTGDPATSYRALFPIAGHTLDKFGNDRFSWFLFPLYGRFEKNHVTTTTAPWPFIKVMHGEGNHGVEVWPLIGQRQKEGVYREQFLLWPFLQRRDDHLDNPARTSHQAHFLPFYAVDRHPGYVSETFGWPFFGYVDRTAPYRYHATNYFWPFWVQGRGDQRYVNRWAPFYSHSNIKGYDKTWVMWPLWRHATWQADGLDQERRQFAFVLYHETEQRSPTNPDLAPARKVHMWPFFSSWDNGAGRRQVQALSPFEPFMPGNDIVRRVWSPLFALYRFDQTKPGNVRHSLLWDAVTYEKEASVDKTEFHLGPLLGIETGPTSQRVSLLGGLLGMQRAPGERAWRLFLGRAKPETSAPAPSAQLRQTSAPSP